MKSLRIFALLFALFLLAFSSPFSWPQGFPPGTTTEGNPLEKSLSLISDTILLVENIQKDSEQLMRNNDSLENALTNVSDMLQIQGQLLNEHAQTQAQLSAISDRQRYLLSRELKKGKILKWSLIASVPACTGLGIWLGWRLSR